MHWSREVLPACAVVDPVGQLAHEPLDKPLQPLMYVPMGQLVEHALHTPLVPVALALPATYAVLRYWPAGHDVTAVASTVLVVAVHLLVTYCVALGAVHAVHEFAVLVPVV